MNIRNYLNATIIALKYRLTKINLLFSWGIPRNCLILLTASVIPFTLLFVIKIKKLPIIERSFLLEQRSDRKLYIGPQDLKQSTKFQKRKDRKRRHEELSLPYTSRSDEDDTLSYESSNTNTDDEFFPAKTSTKRICLDTKSKTDVSGEEKKLQKGIVFAKAKSFPFFSEAFDRI